MAREFSLDQLAAASETPARTIRYYIARGLVKGPSKAGRGATYTTDHLSALRQVKHLQAQGKTLGEIEAMLTTALDGAASPDATPWWRYELGQDVVVMARADASPWRSRLIKEAIRELATRLAASRNRDEEEENKE